MEASDALASESENTDTGGEGGDEKDSSSNESLDRLADRLDTFLDRIGPEEEEGDLYEFASEFADDFDDEDDDDYDDDDDDDDGDLTAEEEAERILNEYVDQRVQERLQPHLQEQQEERRQAQLEDLEQRYPDLQQREHAGPLLENSRRLAAAMGQPELAFQAPFLETVYLRMKAEYLSAAEDEGAEKGGSENPIGARRFGGIRWGRGS